MASGGTGHCGGNGSRRQPRACRRAVSRRACCPGSTFRPGSIRTPTRFSSCLPPPFPGCRSRGATAKLAAVAASAYGATSSQPCGPRAGHADPAAARRIAGRRRARDSAWPDLCRAPARRSDCRTRGRGNRRFRKAGGRGPRHRRQPQQSGWARGRPGRSASLLPKRCGCTRGLAGGRRGLHGCRPARGKPSWRCRVAAASSCFEIVR